MDFRWSLFAVAWVTVTESLSWAEEGLRISRVEGSLAFSAASSRGRRRAARVPTDVVSRPRYIRE